jgi:hypothetical protein
MATGKFLMMRARTSFFSDSDLSPAPKIQKKLVANCQSLVALAECLGHLRANHGGSSVAKGGRRIPSMQLASISLLDPVVTKFLKMS